MFLLKSYKPIFYVLCFSLYTGCSTLEYYKAKPSPKAASNQLKKSFSTLEARLKRQSINQSLKEIEVFILENKDNELTLAAYLLKARLFLKQNRKKEACKTYQQTVNLPFFYINQKKAYFAAAKCLLLEKKIKESLIILEFLIQSPKESLSTKKRASLQQWNSLKKIKSFKDWKLRSLSYLIKFHPKSSNQALWSGKGIKLIDSLNKKELLYLVDKPEKYNSFEGYLLYKTGLHFWNSKNIKSANYYFTQSLSSSLTPVLQKEVKHYLKLLIAIKQTNPYSIGVILPLSGSKKILGQKILRGLSLGFGLEENSPWQLIIMDNKGHPDITKESVEKLLHQYHVIGLIGGIGSESAQVISDMSSKFEIPSILFSQKEGLAENKKFVFQNALTSQTLISQLTKTITGRQLKIKKVAILASNDSYGKEYTRVFSEKFKKLGGQITDIQTYKPNEVDFETPIKKLIQLYNLKKREEEFKILKKAYIKKHPFLSKRSKKLTPKKILKPKFDFEALFIPDSFKTLKKIDAHLKYYGIKKVYLLGTNLWSKQQIYKWSKNRPLIFINTPPISNKSIQASSFFKLYKKTFSSNPSFFEQQAYNTAFTFKKALQKNARTRLALQTELENLNLIEGALYSFKISKNHSFIHPLVIFMTKDDKVITLDSIPVK